MGLTQEKPTKFLFYADQLDNPVNSNWAVNALAPATADNTNAAIVVRAFDDTLEEGVGFILTIPTCACGFTIGFKSKANTAPGSAKTVQTNLYVRTIPNNAVVGAWSAGLALTAIDIPTNLFFQYDTQTIQLSTLGITPGTLVQFELTRDDVGIGTKLVGDWNLAELSVEFV